ncbi:hypothetical protein M1N56_08405 [Dehalococcoidia bacterium]|nr:hypothetical protein [Dehalococcoidia bacterium]
MSPLTSVSSGLVVTPIQNRVWMYAGDFDGDDDLDVSANQHVWLNEGKDKIVSAVTRQKEH